MDNPWVILTLIIQSNKDNPRVIPTYKMHKRKSIRLPEYDYSQAGGYFITICVNNRLQRLGDINNGILKLSEEGLIVEKWIKSLIIKFENIIVEHFIIMPNHIHLIIEIRENKNDNPTQHQTSSDVTHNHEAWRLNRKDMLIPRIINFLKSNSAREINRLFPTDNNKFWQTNYYEHIIRNERSYQKIANYIENNPYNWEDDLYYNNKSL